MRRVVAGVLVLVAVSMAVFALFFYGPNDPAYQYCPENRCTPAKLEQIHHQMGLDRPAPQQYVEYMSGLVHSRTISEGSLAVECDWPCLGVSFKYKVSVSQYLWDRVPATIAVAAGGAICFLALGLFTGIVAARRRGTLADKAIVSSSLVINAVPFYLLALLSFLYLVQRYQLFPPTGYFSPFTEGPLTFVSGMLLPWLMLGIGYATQGLPEGSVVFRHALRAAIVPVVTIFGLDFAGLLTGTVFIEKIFDIQGLGLAGLDAERRVDLPIVSAVVLIGAALIVAANIVVDIVYTLIDPRVRLT